MRLRTGIACVSIAFASSCGGRTEQAAPRKPTDAERQSAWIAEMQLRIRSDLRDPSSAEFRNVRFSRAGGVPAVCGEVNSANAFGGKAGFQRFVAAGEIRVLEEQMEDGAMNEVWRQFC